MIYETYEYFAQHDAEKDREHGPNNNLETYYDRTAPRGDVLHCTVDERERFERETHNEITSDVLSKHQFAAFVLWAQAEGLIDREEVSHE